jgi:hypothetical protein
MTLPVELFINLFINWFYPFIFDGWNIFDFLVVLAAWVSYAVADLPGFGTMRLVRVRKPHPEEWGPAFSVEFEGLVIGV